MPAIKDDLYQMFVSSLGPPQPPESVGGPSKVDRARWLATVKYWFDQQVNQAWSDALKLHGTTPEEVGKTLSNP